MNKIKQFIQKFLKKENIAEKNIKFIKYFFKKAVKSKYLDDISKISLLYYELKYLVYYYILKNFESTPSDKELVIKAISIIRNYETSLRFNKIVLYKLL
jgi:hypothetical protein